MTQNHADQQEEPNYWQIRPGKKPKHTEVFTSDQADIYHVDCAHISASVVDGKVQNQIESIRVTDDADAQAEDKTRSAIVENTAAAIDHSMIEFTIIEDFGIYFTFIKLNVNWSDPCELSLYNTDTNAIQQLARWDNVDFVGIHVDN